MKVAASLLVAAMTALCAVTAVPAHAADVASSSRLASGARQATGPRFQTLAPVVSTVPPPLAGLPALTCAERIDDGVHYRLCSGKVPSFDDVPLDVDVTIPIIPDRGEGPLPLIVMLHGYGNHKGDWESTVKCGGDADRCNYNNLFFAGKGYAVLNFTARGFAGSCGPAVKSADERCARGWTHLGDRRYEIHDTQFLAGLLVDAGVARPGIGVTGDSYGGGQSWLLAVQANTVTRLDGTLVPWTSPQGQAMKIAAAVPKYPWTDLAHSLLPNGRSTDDVLVGNAGAPDRNQPIGIMKQSFVSGLFASGASHGYYSPPGLDPTADLNGWFALLTSGEPYETAAVRAVVDQVTQYRSAYYQDALLDSDVTGGNLTPVLDIQGWTDNLFPQSEGASMISKLRSKSPTWPAFLYTTDVGHPPADDNQPKIWGPANTAGVAFLDHYLMPGKGALPAAIYQEQVVTCDSAVPGEIRSGATLSALAPDTQSFASNTPAKTTSAAGDQPNGLATDPISALAANNHAGCIKLPRGTPELPLLNAVWEFPVCSPFTMLGEPSLAITAVIEGVDAEINSRLWDVAPDGSRTLVTRGAYRWRGQPGKAEFKYAMFGNGWAFGAGHRVRLEVTQNDAPFLRVDNLASTISYGSVRLTLPVVAGVQCDRLDQGGDGNGPVPAPPPGDNPSGGAVLSSKASADSQNTVAANTSSPTGLVLAATGIQIGSAAGGLVLIVAGALLWRRRRRGASTAG